MNLYAALWYKSGYRELNEIARLFYDDGTLIHVFEEHIIIKKCMLYVINDLISAHLSSGWLFTFLSKEYELAPKTTFKTSYI